MNDEVLIEWKTHLSVGIQEIDEQHKVLVGLLNQLHRAINEKQASGVVRSILDQLMEYTRTHFTVEESMMRLLNYPDYEEHKRQHESLLKSLNDLIQKLNDNKASINFELLAFLKMWLNEHILQSDKRYTDHFLNAGVQAKWTKSSWLDRFWNRKT